MMDLSLLICNVGWQKPPNLLGGHDEAMGVVHVQQLFLGQRVLAPSPLPPTIPGTSTLTLTLAPDGVRSPTHSGGWAGPPESADSARLIPEPPGSLAHNKSSKKAPD